MLSLNVPRQVLLGLGSLALVLLAASSGYAQVCSTGGAIAVARPRGSAGPNNFTFQYPLPAPPAIPTFPAATHYLLVDDYPEAPYAGSVSSGFSSFNGGTGLKSEMYYVVDPNQEGAGLTFTSCTIKAFLFADGPSSASAYLSVKRGAIQSDYAISVFTNYPTVYERAMATNPITNASWTSDDLDGLTAVGVRNDPAGNTNAVGIGSIVLECN